MKRPGEAEGEKEDPRAGLMVQRGSRPASLLASRAAAAGLVRLRYCLAKREVEERGCRTASGTAAGLMKERRQAGAACVCIRR